jgi:hypothetical protein
MNRGIALCALVAVAAGWGCSGTAEDGAAPGLGGGAGTPAAGGGGGRSGSGGDGAETAPPAPPAADAGIAGTAGALNQPDEADAAVVLDPEAPDDGEPPVAPDAGESPPSPSSQAVDLLFMIDNSISMSDKQAVLQRTLPDLVQRLVEPACVDATGATFAPPPSGQSCPEGQQREFEPLEDVHIGIISSSLGDVGANAACPPSGFPQFVPDRTDMAHLVGSLERGQNPGATPEGFLEWRAGVTDGPTFQANVQQMVLDVGEKGCGFEAQLESWYRFLADPFPPRALERVVCPGSSQAALNCVQPATDAENRILLDDTLLAQRQAFLRPDSLLAVVMLSDENDCSMQVGGQSWVLLAVDDARPMFRGSSVCATDANDRCCYSCPLGPPEGCEADPICAADPDSGALQSRLPAEQDGKNLRCFQQKRRFGLDALYPTQRYVNALKQTSLCWNALDLGVEGCAPENLVPNPLYAEGRDPSRVFLAGIVGVPWQAIAADKTALGAPLPSGALRFQDARELEQNGTWDAILGSPGHAAGLAGAGPDADSIPAVPPTLPQMVESEFPRPGVTAGNPINGRDYDTVTDIAPDDLEYSCIFPLPEPRDCALRDPAIEACDCYAGDFDRPLCEQTPGVSAPGTTQYWASANPGVRELEVLRGYGDNAVVASICARNVSDAAQPDFGYRPAITGLLERFRARLAAPSLAP